MGGTGRVVFYGLIGIVIALAASFVIFQRHQHERRLKEPASEQSAPGAGGKKPSVRDDRRRDGRRP